MKGGKKREEGGPLVWPVIVIDSGANCSIATDSMYTAKGKSGSNWRRRKRKGGRGATTQSNLDSAEAGGGIEEEWEAPLTPIDSRRYFLPPTEKEVREDL